ncbi:MAG: hypothetical protein EPGJADBJ_04613 [Saprospiraceae bacterium]|nr:hypothetical protein [Saprospiraceae bacterium]
MQKLFAFYLAVSLLALIAFGSFVPYSPNLQSEIRNPQSAFPNSSSPPWGFFAHKRINRLAVLTLPPEMMVFFKPHIDWLADHAVDPDMRRYASKQEAPRHYIDLDVYGTPPFDQLPRLWIDAMIKYTDVWATTASGDTVQVFGSERPVPENLARSYKDFFFRQLLPRFYKDEFLLDADSLNALLQASGIPLHAQTAFFSEHLSEHGIVPWHLQKMQRDLTEAFRQRNSRRILRLCADMGHYIGDAHVPLHTTSNYNGQKTGQHGIHGFWESRVPELFADEEYDFFVGKPVYIADPANYFWQAVFDSHSMVDSVLTMERNLSRSFPSDRQMCPDLRNGLSVLAPCRDYAAAYQTALQGMMERRMRAAIHAVGSAWYTAWVDAGQPDMTKMDVPISTEDELKEEAEMQKMYGQGKILGRPEEH